MLSQLSYTPIGGYHFILEGFSSLVTRKCRLTFNRRSH